MDQETQASDEKRLTLRLSADLWRRLRIEAAKRDVSTTKLINRLLDEKLREQESAG